MRTCIVATLCAIVSILLPGTHDVSAEVTVRSRTVKTDCPDVLVTPEGTTLLMTGRGPASFDGPVRFHVERFSGRKKKNFHRLFPDPDDGKSCLCVVTLGADHSGGMIVYRTSLGKVENAYEITRKVHPAKYHQSKSGDIFAASRTGKVYRMAKGSIDQHQLDVPADASKSSLFREMQFAESKSGIVAVYCITTDDPKRKQLRDLLVAEPGGEGFQKINMDGRAIGPCCFTNENLLLVASGSDLLQVDVESGEVTSTEIQHPQSEGRELEPTKFWQLQDGTIIGSFRHRYRSKWTYDVEEFADGYFHQLAELKEDRWKLLGIGKDRQLYVPQFMFTDKETGIWFTDSGSGLLNRSPEGEWRRFDFHRGVRTLEIDRVIPANDGQVWILNARRRLTQRISLKAIVSDRNEPIPGWSVVYSRTKLTIDQHGNGSLVGLDNGGEIIQFDGVKPTRIRLPASERFVATGPLRMSVDSKGNHWIFAERDGSVAVHRREGWKVYPGSREALMSGLENAFQDVLKGSVGPFEAETYRIGNDLDKYAVSFGPDKQIVFRNSAKRVSYFDGVRWHSPTSGTEVKFRAVNRHPIFHNGDVLWPMSSTKSYSMAKRDWNQVQDVDSMRPWKLIDYEYPRSRTWKHYTNSESKPPFNSPQSSFIGPGENVFAFTENEMAVRDWTGSWKSVPFRDSPAIDEMEFEGGYLDQHGRIFLEIKTPWIYRYAIYEPRSLKVAYTPRPITLKTPFEKVDPDWESSEPRDQLIIRFRLEGRPWSKWFPADQSIHPGGFKAKGKQVLTMQIAARDRLLFSTPLTVPVGVDYELDEFIEPLLPLLGSASFGEREEATEKLIAIGPAVLPQLRALVEQNDLEAALRARQIVETLESLETQSISDRKR